MSFRRLIKFLEVEHPEGATSQDMLLLNKDLLPVPPEQRLWRSWNFYTFWLADAFNLSSFMIGAAMIGNGLSWWQAWLCVIVGYSTAAGFLVLNAIPGAIHHLIFPSYIRSSFGMFGALWPVFNRAGMACIWYGVQAWIGGECVFTLICAMAPSWADYAANGTKNSMPFSSGTDTAHFVSFFLFSLVSLIAIWFPLHTIRHLFTVKAVVAPICGLALFGWCMAKSGGAGPFLRAPSTVNGSALAWPFIANLMSCISNMATLITNAVDFASRASKPRDVIVPQLVALPLTFSVVSLFGILIASSTQQIFGEFVWSPLDIMTRFLEDGTSASRAGVWFISLGFIVAQLGTNIAANSISAGCDLTALMPRFINIRRGGFICAAVGFAMCPWNLLKDSNSFTSYLSAYSVFLSSICGVMIANYYVVTKRRLYVDDLYRLHGSYHYFYGFNLRAYAAYICGIAINLPGFVGAVGHSVPIVATRIYQLSFFTGFLVAFFTFILFNKIWPVRLPTLEECSTVTAGTSAWGKGADHAPSFEEDGEKKEEYGGRVVSV